MLGFGPLGELALGEIPDDQIQSFGNFGLPLRKSGLAAAVIATTFVGFVAPPPAQAALVFTKFSQPFNSRGLIVDEMPSAFFEVLPPAQPSFGGFANFSNAWRAKARSVALLDGFKSFHRFIPPPDRHDLVFMADERKRKKKRENRNDQRDSLV